MRPERRGILNDGLNFVLAASIALLLFNAWFLYFNFQRVADANFWVSHTWSVLGELDQALSSVKDAESGARGFMLMRGEENLEVYRTGTSTVWEHFNKGQGLTTDNPVQISNFAHLRELISSRLKVLAEMVDRAREAGQSNDAMMKLASPLVREGLQSMNSLRSQINVMKGEEQRLLDARLTSAELNRSYFYWSLVLTTLLAVVVISLALTAIKKSQREAQAEADQKAAEARIRAKVADLAQLTVGDLSLKQLSRKILEFVSMTFEGLGAHLYVLENQTLRRMASFAASGETGSEREENEIPAGKGLLGEAVKRGTIWQVNDVPANYFLVNSSLGEARPTALTFLPFEFQGRNVGVIEIASFTEVQEEARLTLSQLSKTIGAALNAAQARDRVQLLLEETQRQSEELFTQQEELRTSNEELEQQARALESQQQALSFKNDELEKTQADIEAKASDLIRANQYKSEFLAKMSHELRTPLNSLLILSTLLIENKERNLTDQQREFAKSIYGAGNDLLNLINDILDLSKIEARKLSLRPETFTIRSLFEQIASTFRPQADARKLEFHLELANDLDNVVIHTDRQRLEQILRNFLSNSMKFTEGGAITLRAEKSKDGKGVALSVDDTGVGIPKDKLHLIFEAFEQADSSVSRKYGGTGLGLTISRELAALLGGEITVHSEEGVGSQFTLTIPLKSLFGAETDMPAAPPERSFMARPSAVKADAAAAADVELSEAARSLVATLDKSEKSILIVEDDASFRHSVAATVRTYNFQPIEAGDGELALEILKVFTPSAILLDIKLPGISGMGVLEITKQMPRLRHIPVHMISAMEFQQNSFRLGALGYLTKPVTLDKIRAALSRIENLITKNVKKLLIVEDDERQLGAIRELVSGPDVQVYTSSSGKEALKIIEHEGLDCIILDLTLPDLSGFEFLNSLNGLDISLPPIVIYTAKDLTREESEGLRKYSESIIIKGARSPERLLDEVNLFLHRVESLLPAAQREMLSHLRSEEKSFEGKTVLIVDDDLRNVFALTSALEAKGLTIKIARNGIEAIEAVQNNQPIDVVLMDLMMPKMDGLEATRRIRAMVEFKRLPIIALTAKAMKEDQEKCIEAGANDYLPKPINLGNLTSVLKVWLAPKGIFA